MKNSNERETDFYTIGFNDSTTMSEAIEILKARADAIANSEEAAKFNKEDPSWSKLFGAEFRPYKIAVEEYERALELNEWLNGKFPDNKHITLLEAFKKMTDQERLSLFHKRVNSNIPTVFDEYLKIWWIHRY